MNILLFLLLGVTQGKMGSTSIGSVNITLRINPTPPTQQQIFSTNNGDVVVAKDKSRYKIIKSQNLILVEPQ